MTDARNIYLIDPTDEARKSLDEFMSGIETAIELTGSADGADLTIDWPDDRLVCDPEHLHAGGRITCRDAFMVAGRTRIELSDLGNLLNHLKIKITNCQLGCFK